MKRPATPRSPEIAESAINILAEGTQIDGKLTVDQVARVHGRVVGEVVAQPGSQLILCETSLVEGGVRADRVWIDGFVRGDIHAATSVVISSTGRVVGNIRTPSLTIDFGAYFEGKCAMEEKPGGGAFISDPTPSPA